MLYKTKNGCTQIPHLFQISAILIFIANLIMIIVLISKMTLLQKVITHHSLTILQVILLLFFAITSLLVIIFFLFTSLIDPTDINVRKNVKNTTSEFFCQFCKVDVQISSKHCNYCKRCVDRFDHHCKWVNNCIGGRNYFHFFQLIIWTETYLIIVIVVYSLLQTIQNDKFQFSAYDSYLIIFFLIINCFLALLNLYLIVLHIWLRVNNLTTYQWILERRKRNQDNESKIRNNKQQIHPQDQNYIQSTSLNFNKRNSKVAFEFKNCNQSPQSRLSQNKKVQLDTRNEPHLEFKQFQQQTKYQYILQIFRIQTYEI